MTKSIDLERRYRRLLAFYPRPFRREHEEEMVSVLMDGASDAQRRPAPAEVRNVVRHGLWMRMRYGILWERSHYPRLWFVVRVAVGIWLCIVTAALCWAGHWWGLSLLAFVALHFYLAYGNRRSMRNRPS